MRKLLAGLFISNIAFLGLTAALLLIGVVADIALIKHIFPQLFGVELGSSAKVPGATYVGALAAVFAAIICGYFAASRVRERPRLAGFLSSIIAVGLEALIVSTSTKPFLELIPAVLGTCSLPFFGLLGAALRSRITISALRGWMAALAVAIIAYALVVLLGFVLVGLSHARGGLMWILFCASFSAIYLAVWVMPIARRPMALNIFGALAVIIPILDAARDAIVGHFTNMNIATIIVNFLACWLAYRSVQRRLLNKSAVLA